MTTIHDILERLRKVHKQGKGWTACCPAHEDDTPSLSVGIGDDGRFLVCCQAGCRAVDVMRAIGLELRDLFPEKNGPSPAFARPASGTVATTRNAARARAPAVRTKPRSPEPVIDWESVQSNIQESLVGVEVATLALELSVTDTSLARLGCGWSEPHDAYSFPMRDGSGKIIGIALRDRSGKKRCITDSHLGLFIPQNLNTTGPLFFPEGPSDTATLLDLGFAAIGRSSAILRNERLDQLRALLTSPACRRRDMVIVADVDSHETGWRGADGVAQAIVRYARSVKIIEPLWGCKDMRQWVRRGATASMVRTLVENQARVV